MIDKFIKLIMIKNYHAQELDWNDTLEIKAI